MCFPEIIVENEGKVSLVRANCSEPHLEVFVAELADGLPAAVFVAGDDGRQGHAVEGVVLDHGVDGHVTKDDAVADGEGLVEGVGADGVAGEAGRTGEGVGMGLLPRLAAAEDGRTVGHLDDVGHVAGGRGVEDGDGVFLLDVEHLGDEEAGVQRDGLAGLDVDGQAVLLLHMADALLEKHATAIMMSGSTFPFPMTRLYSAHNRSSASGVS